MTENRAGEFFLRKSRTSRTQGGQSAIYDVMPQGVALRPRCVPYRGRIADASRTQTPEEWPERLSAIQNGFTCDTPEERAEAWARHLSDAEHDRLGDEAVDLANFA